TPDFYFRDQISWLREAAGRNVPITIFSDGNDEELRFALELPNIVRARAPNDVIELLLMSRARVIVASAGSSFSDWAGYLSEGGFIRHPDHIHAPIRPSATYGALEVPAPRSLQEWNAVWRRTIEPCLESTANKT